MPIRFQLHPRAMSSRIRPSRLATIGLAAGLAIAVPNQAALFAQDEGADSATRAASSDVAGSFTAFEALPVYPAAQGEAVDITTISPPIEKARPKPKPKPATSSRKVRTLGNGVASYYGRRFHGRLTANGERFNMNAMTAAHKTLPFGTKVRVTNRNNGKSVVVRINDRGPFIRGRHIDLSRAAGSRIGLIKTGHARVKMDIVK